MSRRPRSAVDPRAVLVAVAAMAVLGVVAGAVWQWWWTPAEGAAVDGRFLYTRDGVREAVDSTALFLIVAALGGALAGTATAVVLRRRPWTAFVAVLVGSIVATAAMTLTGRLLGPPDPDALAATAEEGARLVDALRVRGVGAYAVLPAAALTALGMVFLGWSDRGSTSGERPAHATQVD